MGELYYTIAAPSGDLMINGQVDTGEKVGFFFSTEQKAADFVLGRNMSDRTLIEQNSREDFRRWLIFNRDVNGVELAVLNPTVSGQDWIPIPCEVLLQKLDSLP